jgi:hypothetical protein
MQYFYRAHTTPETVLGFARTYFTGRGFTADPGAQGRARYAEPKIGSVDVKVETEGGGHYTRVTIATRNLGESEVDKVAKRFLSELHTLDEPQHVVRGNY